MENKSLRLAFGQSTRQMLAWIESCTHLIFGPNKRSILLSKGQQPLQFLPNSSSFLKAAVPSAVVSPFFFQCFEQAATKTYSLSGDGSTLTFIFASTLLKDALQLIAAGYNLSFLQNGLKKLNFFFLTKILNAAQPVKDSSTLAGVLRTTFGCKLSPDLLPFLQTSTTKLQRDTVFCVEENLTPTHEMEEINGLEIEKGFASSYFVNDTNQFAAIYDNPWVLITTLPLHHVDQLAEILNDLQQSKRPLVIFTQEISKDLLSTLIVNTIQKKLNVVVVKYTSIEFLKDGLLEDLALLTHTHFVQKENTSSTWRFTKQDLGVAKKITVTKSKTTCFVSKFGQVLLTRHLNELARELTLSDSEYERDVLKTRMNRLSGQFLKLKFAPTYQVEEQNRVLENILQTLQAALEEGILPGGASFHESLKLELFSWAHLNLMGDEMIAAYLLGKSLSKPGQLLFPQTSVLQMCQTNGYPYSYDLIDKTLVQCWDRGLVDAAKSIRGSFWNAITMIHLMISTYDESNSQSGRGIAH